MPARHLARRGSLRAGGKISKNGLTFNDNIALKFGTGDDVSISFDGTELNIDGTVDLNITSFTAINAGTVDADFDAITATSYGGIVEANLLDKSDSETVPGAYDFTTGGLTVDSNHVLQGYATGKNIVRSVRLRIEPGSTPGTNIIVSGIEGIRGFNDPTVSDATNLAKSGTSGDFALNASGEVITYSGVTVVGLIGAFLTLHDLNSSSTTELYFVDAREASGGASLRIFKRGSTAAVDWTTIMDAGDRAEVQLILATSD